MLLTDALGVSFFRNIYSTQQSTNVKGQIQWSICEGSNQHHQPSKWVPSFI